MLKIYGDRLIGPTPSFPNQMEQRITDYLQRDAEPVAATVARSVVEPSPLLGNVAPAEYQWLKKHATVFGPVAATTPSSVLKPVARQ
jgi:hypothetical protein